MSAISSAVLTKKGSRALQYHNSTNKSQERKIATNARNLGLGLRSQSAKPVTGESSDFTSCHTAASVDAEEDNLGARFAGLYVLVCT